MCVSISLLCTLRLVATGDMSKADNQVTTPVPAVRGRRAAVSRCPDIVTDSGFA
jgi:hypothetical protein